MKGYGKRIDQGADLHPSQWVARTEARLSASGLESRGLERLSDLTDFRFRKVLMPYFSLVRGAKLRVLKSDADRPMLAMLKTKQQEYVDAEWARVGVGCALRGGKYEGYKLRFLSHTAVNNRIGQALLRLEQRMDAEFVRDRPDGVQE
ncbi:hypothetical protein [Ramlibacter montanisoli]|uniref:Uncharacterized protein n=1 Tax=Ramlibacter montanisoli TaxID=2732512 RepID=A0A849KF63_9BURK|nr:hypothetical protein [Ramlibacter montanisoli]NNU43575.1 hypothetical protein [Ramlibacter montanisoli]